MKQLGGDPSYAADIVRQVADGDLRIVQFHARAPERLGAHVAQHPVEVGVRLAELLEEVEPLVRDERGDEERRSELAAARRNGGLDQFRAPREAWLDRLLLQPFARSGKDSEG